MSECPIIDQLAVTDDDRYEKLKFVSPVSDRHLEHDSVRDAILAIEKAARRMVATAYKSSNQHNDFVQYSVGTVWLNEMRDALLNLQQWCEYYSEPLKPSCEMCGAPTDVDSIPICGECREDEFNYENTEEVKSGSGE